MQQHDAGAGAGQLPGEGGGAAPANGSAGQVRGARRLTGSRPVAVADQEARAEVEAGKRPLEGHRVTPDALGRRRQLGDDLQQRHPAASAPLSPAKEAA